MLHAISAYILFCQLELMVCLIRQGQSNNCKKWSESGGRSVGKGVYRFVTEASLLRSSVQQILVKLFWAIIIEIIIEMAMQELIVERGGVLASLIDN